MKVHTCDICGNEIGKDNPPPAQVSSQGAFKVGEKILPFTYSLRIDNYGFTRPDFDVCQKCVLSALSNPPAELSPSK